MLNNGGATRASQTRRDVPLAAARPDLCPVLPGDEHLQDDERYQHCLSFQYDEDEEEMDDALNEGHDTLARAVSMAVNAAE